MTRHRGDELVAVERVQIDVPDSRDRRCSRHVAEERDLAEVVAGTELPHRRSVHRDLELAGVDDEEAVAGLSLAYDGIARPRTNQDELAREPFDLSLRKRGEDRDLAEKGELPDWERERRVDRAQAVPEEQAERGQKAPAAISAPRFPDPVDEGRRQTMAPIPIAPMIRLSTAPKTRPSTSSGTARWSNVGAATSTRVSPMPMNAIRTRADAGLGKIPIRIKGMPQSSVPIAKSEAKLLACDQRDRHRGADEPSDAECGVEVADARSPEMQQLHRGDDNQNTKRTRDHRLGAVEARQGRARLGDDRGEAGERLLHEPLSASRSRLDAGGASARILATWRAESRNVAAVTERTASTLVVARRRPPSAGPAKLPTDAIVLMATLAAVSSSGCGRWSSSADCAGLNVVERIVTTPGKHVHDRGRQRESDDERRAHERDRARDVGEQHHALAAEAIGENGRERRDNRAGEDPNQHRRARRRRRPLRVREH